ncbi:SGNH/GDSL hydrolase family protein [Planctomycetota bacterium]
MLDQKVLRLVFLMLLSIPILLIGSELIKNGDFSSSKGGWSGLGTDENKDVSIVKLQDGKPALKLERKVEGAKVNAVQYNLKMKPQTLYKLSVTGYGEAKAKVSMRPESSKDKEFFGLSQSWATSSAPLISSGKPDTQVLFYDSGLKADNAFLNLYLAGKAPGAYYLTAVSMAEAGSAVPDKKETVIVHIGDSVTITSYLPFSQRVDALLQARLEKELPKKKFRNINLGVDGEWIGALLDTGRYEAVMKDNLKKIDIAIIRYGANDRRKYDVTEFKKKYNMLCDNLERDYPGIKITIGTGPYIHGSGDANKNQYGPYWRAGREVARERKYPVADIYKAFEKEATEATAIKKGDAHPSADGVGLVAETEYAVLKKLLVK